MNQSLLQLTIQTLKRWFCIKSMHILFFLCIK